MKIISYQTTYKNQIIDFILSIQNNEFGLNFSLAEQPDLLNIEHYFKHNWDGFWLAIKEHKVVGTIGLKRISSNECILKKFFVDKAYRGQKIGLELYEHFMAFCQEKNITHIVLDTPSIATRSHQFYKQHGFNLISKEQLPFPYTYPDRNSLLFYKKR